MLPNDSLILVVDDSKNMRELIITVLSEIGFKNYVQAANGDEALRQLDTQSENQDPVKLVLSDYDMPGMSGLEFLKAMRSNPKFSNLPFIVISAHGQFNAIVDIVSAGADSFIVKPFEKRALVEKISAAWKKRCGDEVSA